jgi:pectate lyase
MSIAPQHTPQPLERRVGARPLTYDSGVRRTSHPAVAVILAATAAACGDSTLYPWREVEVKECPPTTMLGFAAVAGNGADGGVAEATTGGNNGLAVQVSDVAGLTAELQRPADQPRIIVLTGMLTLTAPIKVTLDRDVRGGNKTLMGVGASSGLTGAGLDLSYTDNIIIRNIKIAKASADEGDAITLLNAHHVWIDHCDLSSDRNDTTSGYDGLIDITHGSSYLTISWTVFHDHRDTSRVGHTADPTAQAEDSALRVTYHHNMFSRVNSGPRVRWGIAHVANNLFRDVTTFGVVSESAAYVKVEYNKFDNDVKMPIATTYQDDVSGTMEQKGDIFPPNFAIDIMRPTIMPDPLPYSYTPDSADGASALVSGCAGTGKPEN